MRRVLSVLSVAVLSTAIAGSAFAATSKDLASRSGSSGRAGNVYKVKRLVADQPGHAKATDPNAGACVSCNRCVAVCPTGIDIRQGLQLECVGCANCVQSLPSTASRRSSRSENRGSGLRRRRGGS